MSTAAILLAAGASRRFGAEDKLLAPFRGQPLVCHAARALRALAPDHLLAVVQSDSVAKELAGFETLRPGGRAQSDSLKAGIVRAKALGAGRALVCLGDMPLIPAAHLARLLATATTDTPAATHDGRRPMPPACFPRAYFDALLQLAEDQGARAMLQQLPANALVAAPPASLADVDRRADLARLQRPPDAGRH